MEVTRVIQIEVTYVEDIEDEENVKAELLTWKNNIQDAMVSTFFGADTYDITIKDFIREEG